MQCMVSRHVYSEENLIVFTKAYSQVSVYRYSLQCYIKGQKHTWLFFLKHSDKKKVQGIPDFSFSRCSRAFSHRRSSLKDLLDHRKVYFSQPQTGTQCLNSSFLPKMLSPQNERTHNLQLHIKWVTDFATVKVILSQAQGQDNVFPFRAKSSSKLVNLLIRWWVLQNMLRNSRYLFI